MEVVGASGRYAARRSQIARHFVIVNNWFVSPNGCAGCTAHSDARYGRKVTYLSASLSCNEVAGLRGLMKARWVACCLFGTGGLVRTSILLVDSDVSLLKYIAKILVHETRLVTACSSGNEALRRVGGGDSHKLAFVGCNITDISYPDLVAQIYDRCPRIATVLMPYLDERGDTLAMIGAGVRRVLSKPFVPDQLLGIVAEFTRTEDSTRRSEAVTVRIADGTSFVYGSASMREIQQQAALVAPFSLPVLILGESGTGKEVIARYIHSLSRQARSTLLKVNCAAVPSELLESELFGYEQGAFTGAGHAKPGKFKLCDGGTMFLDEIGEMHPSLQAKLLQVLQDGTFTPLGSRGSVKVNVRVIAATNIDMKAAIANRSFREDLYYRLNGFCFTLPPLRERREDIPVLMAHFLKRYSQELGLPESDAFVSPRLLKTCLRYDWPGNLRELETFVKRHLVLRNEQFMMEELTRDIREQTQPVDLTVNTIQGALRQTGGNRRAAAKSLNISYKVLLHRLREFGLITEPSSP